MTLLIILGALALLAAAAILIPRVHVRADVDLAHVGGQVDSVWFSVSGDTREKGIRGRILFFRFFRETSESETAASAPEPSIADQPSAPADLEAEILAPKKAALEGEEPPAPKASRKKSKSREREFDWRELWAEKDLLFAVLKRFASGFWRFFRSVRADYLNLELTLGLNDAMTTALALGCLHPLYFLSGERRRINLTPRFDDYAFDFQLACSFSLRPIQAVGVILREALRFPWFRVLRLGFRLYFAKSRHAKPDAPIAAASVESNL